MSRAHQRFRQRSIKARNAQRLGSRIETLESRQMMFGDTLPTVDIVPVHDRLPLEIPDNLAIEIAGDQCIDFEDLAPVASYGVGTSFVADNTGFQAKITGEPFTWSGGGMTAMGMTTVEHANLAAHAGQEMAVNNILLNFDFGGKIAGLRLNFGEYGGNLNLEINGDFRNFEDFQDVHGAMIGGTHVTVPVGGTGQDAGVLQVTGDINSFKIGGQELWIDHVCGGQREEYRLDWGDAPDKPYPTLASHNGAVHRIDPDVFLGRLVDGEADGQPTAASDGDDNHGPSLTDDEDGVRFLTPLTPGACRQSGSHCLH